MIGEGSKSVDAALSPLSREEPRLISQAARSLLLELVTHFLLLLACVVALYPVLWVISLALSAGDAPEARVLPIPTSPSLDHFASVLGQSEWYGTCGNPTHPGKTTGGSSSGSAAALAAGVCELAMTGPQIANPIAQAIDLTPCSRCLRRFMELARS